MSGFFASYKIDHRSKASMMTFIQRHETHNDGLFAPATIANCIKLHSLPIPRDLQNTAWDVLADELGIGERWGVELMFDIQDFEADHPGYKVYTAGRSGGWVELHHVGDSSVFAHLDPAINEEYDIRTIREFCELIEEFDQFCDMVLDDFIQFVADYKEECEERAAEDAREAEAALEPAFPL